MEEPALPSPSLDAQDLEEQGFGEKVPAAVSEHDSRHQVEGRCLETAS